MPVVPPFVDRIVKIQSEYKHLDKKGLMLQTRRQEDGGLRTRSFPINNQLKLSRSPIIITVIDITVSIKIG